MAKSGKGTLHAFPWSGRGKQFISCPDGDRFVIGAGGRHASDVGLLLDSALSRGSSGPCETFGNPVLCPNQCIDGERMDIMRSPTSMNAEEFEVAQVEVWGVDPTALMRAREHAAAAAALPYKKNSPAPPFNVNMSNMLLDGF